MMVYCHDGCTVQPADEAQEGAGRLAQRMPGVHGCTVQLTKLPQGGAGRMRAKRFAGTVVVRRNRPAPRDAGSPSAT